jgi:dienelactone hydrolase
MDLMMKHLLFSLAVVVLFHADSSLLKAGDPAKDISRVLESGALPDDSRLGELRMLRDKYHPWSPPTTKAAWVAEKKRLRNQVLVSNGLLPMPPKRPLKPVIYGKVDRGDYTVEKVFFASHSGHYVTGSLFRPKKIEGKAPGILSPHGHWTNARFYDAGDKKAEEQLGKNAESFDAAAHHPVQARMVQLARMGCIVFHYDMVGYADSQQIKHRQGFTGVEAGLRLQNFMGLQTFNSIRALDFLTSLPEVDSKRIGVTGASGGGTQTFMICAIDPRPAAAFPAVMVSTNMQGGCVCENAEYLRLGINNIAIAALFAPKPMALSGANDWTIDIETKGLPELRQIYSLYGKRDFVQANCFPQFNHNYNQLSRTLMYKWFNTHLNVGIKFPVEERDFEPVSQAELTVFNDAHPFPKNSKSSEQLRSYLTKVSDRQYQALLPKNTKQLAKYRRIVGTAARVMLDVGVPGAGEVTRESKSERLGDDLRLIKGVWSRKGSGEQIPYVVLIPDSENGTAVIWVDGQGKSHLFDDNGKPKPAVQKLLDSGRSVISVDVFLTGEFVADGKEPAYPKVNETYQGYTFGYNRPVLSNRVRDILTAIGAVFHYERVNTVELIGTGNAGPWTLLAASLAGDTVKQVIVDANGFSFAKIDSVSDPMFLPGALKYGGLGGLAALAAPTKLTVAGTDTIPTAELKPLTTVYTAAGGDLSLQTNALSPKTVAAKLLE